MEDAQRSGRPSKQDAQTSATILSKVRLDRFGREKSCADLCGELSEIGINISATTIWRILKSAGLRKTKPTRKPGLTKKMKANRLAQCLEYQHWTLEDFKNVIQSDETLVVLLHRRGGYRIWRTKDEAFVRSCIRERQKDACEFMFWGCFTYDEKCPYHCQKPETAQEKRDSKREIEQLNLEIEPLLQEQQELETQMRRMNIRR